MSITSINSKKISVAKLFDEYWFKVPEYQRPYVWGKDQVSTLLDDLTYACKSAFENEYFLGSIVFHQKKEEKDGSEYFESNLLDGQQRLTTVFLLMAVVRDLTDNSQRKQTCQSFIFQEANPDKNIPERVRILFKIRDEVQSFIDTYVKQSGGTQDIKLQSLTNDSDISIKNMSFAIQIMGDYIRNMTHVTLDDLFKFLLNKVHFVYVSSEELNDAFKLFTVLNDRGIKLRNSDILKAENLRFVHSTDDRERYAKVWEETENEFREDFDRFLAYIRTILLKDKARFSILKEFEDKIYKVNATSGVAILNKGKDTFEILKKYKDHFNELLSGDNSAKIGDFSFDNLVGVMNNGYESTDWIPPLLHYYAKFDINKIVEFSAKLDNKFSFDWLSGKTPTTRIENMNSILKQIEASETPDQLLSSTVFQIDINLIESILNEDIYGKPFDQYILLKLDYIYQDQTLSSPRSVPKQLSIEHILPRNPNAHSQWCSDFDEENRKQWTNKIGNLILLSRKKNSSQSRQDYLRKKSNYFATNINSFPNSVRVMKSASWALMDLKNNHTSIVADLKNHYMK